MKLIEYSPKIWAIQGFLSPEECEHLMEKSESIGYEEADVSFDSGSKMVKSIRDNYRVTLVSQELADEFWERVKPFCPGTLDEFSAFRLNERFRFYRYSDNQKFKRHRDGRIKLSEEEESRITMMVYLNDDFEGGETAFKDVTIKPEAGMALMFIHEQKHEGCPVSDGVKYAIRTDVFYKRHEDENE